jgi:N-acetylglutamate synthase-like GNAT family acetyltransferase
MIDFEISEYRDELQKEVENLILNIQQNEFSIPITVEQQPDIVNVLDFYKVGYGNFWVATRKGKVIGTIALLDIGNKQAALRKMFVDSSYRGKEFGTGQKLLETLLNWGKKQGIKEVFLGTTEKFLAAQRFYEKNGFVEIEKVSLPDAFPVMAVDVKFYKHTFLF